MQNREIVRFYENGLYDFKEYILPDVFDQLLVTKDYEDMQIVCAGALLDGKAIGAAVAQLLENNEVYLQSIIVDEAYQKQGIGTDLLNGILREAFAEFSEDNDIEALPTNVFIHTDYVLPKEEVDGFDAFLKKFGFSDFYEMEECLYIEGEKLVIPESFETPKNVISFASDAGGHEAELEVFLRNEEMDVDLNNAFILTEKDKAKAIILAENGMDNEYFLQSFSEGEISDGEFEALFYALAKALKRGNKDFFLVADEHFITNPQCLEEITKACQEIYSHKEAGCYCLFSGEKE